ncbi:OmpA family protein [Ulvibacter litoralis]|uniref:Chemotaxis protein MotB n=1 Tax=Ulvibacter litoralis TaxID=227084 RepID=A0A1G7CYC9_9FLAO|nr:OmpA family protein [Ulvibacter litoralis]GHC45803.1 cell envelope biogenesis protein OmpA [Ulvibacter litoralis]SDE43656.1 chemotaxis protein MotB [Ulvibacter litoralis]
MIKNIFFGIALVAMTTSCVSSKIYEDLKDKYASLKSENEDLMSQLDGAEGNADTYTLANLQKKLDELNAEKSRLAMDLSASESNYKRLKDSYDALEKNSSSSLTENLELNRNLLTQLEEKERALTAEAERLKQLQSDLAARSQRVDELEGIIASKDAKMKALKNAISAALTNFEGNGLTVEQRDGKVYVSMENKLLFESGSWAVNSRGKEAVVALGKVLADNPEIAVLIEGHTDNVPYGGNGTLQDNWDLSAKRATAVVTILTQNGSILKDNLTAAGRGEYAPIAPNNTSEGRAKNRRIEVILTPKLDEINKLLNEI